MATGRRRQPWRVGRAGAPGDQRRAAAVGGRRSQDDVLTAGETWKAAMVEKSGE